MTAAVPATVTVHSAAAMEALGRGIGHRLVAAIEPSAGAILGLEGDLGAGKTTFVRGLVAGVTGLDRVVTSPTFQLMNLYRPETGDPGEAAAAEVRTLAHIDAYRLTGAQAFWELGIADLLEENMIVAVEWPSRTRHSIFETEAVLLQFDHVDESTRRVTRLHAPPHLSGLTLAP